MNVTPIPLPVVQPVVQVVGPPLSASGLYEVTIWQNNDREEGLLVRVPTLAHVDQVVAIVKDRFKDRAQL